MPAPCQTVGRLLTHEAWVVGKAGAEWYVWGITCHRTVFDSCRAPVAFSPRCFRLALLALFGSQLGSSVGLGWAGLHAELGSLC